MWPADSRAAPVLWLYMGAQCVQSEVRLGGRWLDDSFQSSPLAWGDEDGMCGVLRGYAQSPSWLRAARQAKHLRVVISDHWLACASVPWSSAQLTGKEAVQDARDHLAGAGYELAAQDDVRLNDCPARQPRLALAHRAGILAAVRALAREVGVDTVRVESLGVSIASRLACAGKSRVPTCLAIIEPGGCDFRSAVLVKLEPQSTRVERMISRNYSQDHERPWQGLAQALTRLAWVDASAGNLCAVLDGHRSGPSLLDTARFEKMPWLPVDWGVSGEPPASGSSEWLKWLGSDTRPVPGPLSISLARARASVSGYRRASATGMHLSFWHVGAIATIIGATVWFGGQAAQHQRSLDALRHAKANLVQTAQDAKSLSPPTREKLLAVNRAIAHLNIPLENVLAAIQPPKDIEIGLLGLEASAENVSRTGAAVTQPALKIVAEAPTAADMTRYVAYLSGRRPLTHAELLRHELAASANSAPLYRFSIEIGWRP